MPSRGVIVSQPRPSDRSTCLRSKKCAILCVISAVMVIVAIVSVIPLSFSYVEYHQYGFKTQKSTGKVFLDKIYKSGRYFFGPDFEFLLYKADAHFMDLDEIDIFTHDKLEVKLTVHLQYVLREDELTLLHQKFNVYYEDVMVTSAIDALKGAVPVYTTRELIRSRSAVEAELYRAVRQRLGGICCRPDCSQSDYACTEGCKPVKSCTDKDKGLNADVIFFQLGELNIPGDVEVRYMEALVLQEKALREKLLQNASVVRKETQAQVKAIKNEATEVIQNATAQANLNRSIANSEYNRIREEAKIIGLVRALKNLNITEQEKKLSFDYLKALMNNGKVKLTVDFDKLIAGNL